MMKFVENMISNKICKKCGECCRNFPFVELSKNEILSLEQATALHHDVFTNSKGEEVEEYFLQFQANGDCFFLIQHNGGYSCGAYEARPGICKNYPAKPGQKEACYKNREKSLSNDPG